VTTPERTALDLARFLGPHVGLGVVDAMARRGQIDLEALTHAVEAWRGNGEACRPGDSSDVPSRTRGGLASHGCGCASSTQVSRDRNPRSGSSTRTGSLCIDSTRDGRNRRIAIEYDGVEFHYSPEQGLRDIARREDLSRRFGWDVLGVGRGEVLGRSLALERGIGEMLGLAPQLVTRT
jgi:hypothetical protein